MATSDLDSGCLVVRVTQAELDRREMEARLRRQLEMDKIKQQTADAKKQVSASLQEMGAAATGLLVLAALLKFFGAF